MRHQKEGAKLPLMERTGWCWSGNLGQHHPVCALTKLRSFFLLRAAAPPRLRRGILCSPQICYCPDSGAHLIGNVDDDLPHSTPAHRTFPCRA
jgi:hypothetical protein